MRTILSIKIEITEIPNSWGSKKEMTGYVVMINGVPQGPHCVDKQDAADCARQCIRQLIDPQPHDGSMPAIERS